MDRRLIKGAREALFWTNWRLHLTIPSVLAEGEEFTLRMTAFDAEEVPAEGYGRRIRFGESPGVEGLPESAAFEKGDGGCMEISGLKAAGPEHAFVTAEPEGCPGRVTSNGALVFRKPPWRIYWGDIHVHTTFSNCSPWACKDPEFGYGYARDATHLDFCAAADHLRGIASDGTRWPRLQELVRRYDAPGEFVPLLAFESSHKSGYGGDNNAYFAGWEGPYFWVDREDMKGTSPEVPLQDLWAFLDGAGEEYFTVPHHTGRAGKYRDFSDGVYDAARERLFEVYSAWGSSEMPGGRYPLYAGESERPCYLRDALRQGCRYGVIGSSDDHRTLPGGMSSVWSAPTGPKGLAGYMQHGLAGVMAESLERDALWEALKRRRCYAATYERAVLDVRVGDVEMGCEGRLSSGDGMRRRREVKVRYFNPNARGPRAVLVRNGRETAVRDIAAGETEFSFVDEEDVEDVALREARYYPGAFVVYYVRLEDRMGQTQWSSPVWLDF
ncbi:MAG: hypothetical protein JW909_04220 [Planctomycetes bacterium]|nr:hypothetical protein [Planctomycetota bacterium]